MNPQIPSSVQEAEPGRGVGGQEGPGPGLSRGSSAFAAVQTLTATAPTGSLRNPGARPLLGCSAAPVIKMCDSSSRWKVKLYILHLKLWEEFQAGECNFQPGGEPAAPGRDFS